VLKLLWNKKNNVLFVKLIFLKGWKYIVKNVFLVFWILR
jgi:hypothetical protein